MKVWNYWVGGYIQPEDAYSIVTGHIDHDYVVEKCAEDYHDNENWREDTWPLKFTVESPDGESKTFLVNRVIATSFTVVEDVL